MRAGGDPLTVGGAATWDGGVELGEDGFVAAAEAGLTVPVTRLPGSLLRPPLATHLLRRPPLQRRSSNAKGYLYHRRMRQAPAACPGAQRASARALCKCTPSATSTTAHIAWSTRLSTSVLLRSILRRTAAMRSRTWWSRASTSTRRFRPSASYYPAVFPFENEAHDLFGLAITDMQIDFKGFFYQVSTAEPMSVITPEVKAAREKAMKVRAAAEAKARKAAAEKAAAAAAAAGEGAASAGDAAGAAAQPAAAAGPMLSTMKLPPRALKAAEMEAKLAAMIPRKRPRSARRLPPRPPATSRKRRRKAHGTSLRYSRLARSTRCCPSRFIWTW